MTEVVPHMVVLVLAQQVVDILEVVVLIQMAATAVQFIKNYHICAAVFNIQILRHFEFVSKK